MSSEFRYFFLFLLHHTPMNHVCELTVSVSCAISTPRHSKQEVAHPRCVPEVEVSGVLIKRLLSQVWPQTQGHACTCLTSCQEELERGCGLEGSAQPRNRPLYQRRTTERARNKIIRGELY